MPEHFPGSVIPKLHPPGEGRCLPPELSIAWARGLMTDHAGGVPLPTLVPIWLDDTLNAHAGEILPILFGSVMLDDDLLRFAVRLRRVVRVGNDLVERAVDVPFAYDRRTGQWSDGGLAAGRGLIDFFIWHAEATRTPRLRAVNRAVARQAMIQHLLLWLGSALIETRSALARAPLAGADPAAVPPAADAPAKRRRVRTS